MINLDAVPDDPQDFSFAFNYPAGDGFTLDDDSDPTLAWSHTITDQPEGNYVVQQVVPDGWAVTGIVCTDPDSGTTTELDFAVARVDLDAGETVSCTFMVEKADTTPPTLTLPPNMLVNATGPSGATVAYSASASDLVDPSPTLTCAPASGSVLPIGTTTVICTATDNAGNSASDSFTITVRGAGGQITALIAKTKRLSTLLDRSGVQGHVAGRFSGAGRGTEAGRVCRARRVHHRCAGGAKPVPDGCAEVRAHRRRDAHSRSRRLLTTGLERAARAALSRVRRRRRRNASAPAHASSQPRPRGFSAGPR